MRFSWNLEGFEPSSHNSGLLRQTRRDDDPPLYCMLARAKKGYHANLPRSRSSKGSSPRARPRRRARPHRPAPRRTTAPPQRPHTRRARLRRARRPRRRARRSTSDRSVHRRMPYEDREVHIKNRIDFHVPHPANNGPTQMPKQAITARARVSPTSVSDDIAISSTKEGARESELS